MLIDSCPYCDAPFVIELPDVPLPQYYKHDCDECNAPMWTKLSRVSPASWTESKFHAVFLVDDEKHEIRERGN